MRPTPTLALALALCAACASQRTAAPAPAAAAATAEEREPDVAAGSSKGAPTIPQEARAVEASAPVAAEPEAELPPTASALWSDPLFQKAFTESYLAVSDVEPSVDLLEREFLGEVKELLSKQRFDRALSLLAKHDERSSTAVVNYTIASIQFQLAVPGEAGEAEKLRAAAAQYEEAIEKHERFQRAHRSLGFTRLKLAELSPAEAKRGEYAGAAESLARAVELGATDALTYGLLAAALSGGGQHVAAESAFRMAVMLQPETTSWSLGLAQCFLDQGRFADVVSLCDSLLAKDPDNERLWKLQASAHVSLGQPLRAAQDLEVLDRLGKSTAETLGLLADIYVNEGLFEMGASSHQRSLAMGGLKSPARALRAAKVLAARGAPSEARDLLDGIERAFGEGARSAGARSTAGELEPVLAGDGGEAAGLAVADRKEILRLRSRIALAEGAGLEEARALERLVELDPLDGDALIDLGRYWGRAGDTEKAVFLFERAAAIDGFEADAKLRHGQLLVREQRYAEALPLLKRAQTLKPRAELEEYVDNVERISKTRDNG